MAEKDSISRYYLVRLLLGLLPNSGLLLWAVPLAIVLIMAGADCQPFLGQPKVA